MDASSVALPQLANTQSSVDVSERAASSSSATKSGKAAETIPAPFETGLALPGEALYMVSAIKPAQTKKEEHSYTIKPLDQTTFHIDESQLLRTSSIAKGQRVWHMVDTGGDEIVTVLNHIVKRRDECYASPALKEARAGQPGQSDMVARIVYREDNIFRGHKEDDADKFYAATNDDVWKWISQN